MLGSANLCIGSPSTVDNSGPKPIQIDSRLPRYVTSENGMIGDGHLIHFLDKDKPSNITEIILESFSKRKFQSGCHDDKINLPKTFNTLNKGCFYTKALHTDTQGFAICRSGPINIFISDDDIKKIDSCVSYERNQSQGDLFIGFYPDGKCIITQPSYLTGSTTSLAMLLIDRGVKDFDFSPVFKNPMGHNTIFYNLKIANEITGKYGYELVTLDFDENASKCQEWIKEHGSLLVLSKANKIFLLDSINENEAIIRDPHHGWRITVDFNYFAERLSGWAYALKKAENIY